MRALEFKEKCILIKRKIVILAYLANAMRYWNLLEKTNDSTMSTLNEIFRTTSNLSKRQKLKLFLALANKTKLFKYIEYVFAELSEFNFYIKKDMKMRLKNIETIIPNEANRAIHFFTEKCINIWSVSEQFDYINHYGVFKSKKSYTFSLKQLAIMRFIISGWHKYTIWDEDQYSFEEKWLHDTHTRLHVIHNIHAVMSENTRQKESESTFKSFYSLNSHIYEIEKFIVESSRFYGVTEEDIQSYFTENIVDTFDELTIGLDKEIADAHIFCENIFIEFDKSRYDTFYWSSYIVLITGLVAPLVCLACDFPYSIHRQITLISVIVLIVNICYTFTKSFSVFNSNEIDSFGLNK